MYNHKSKVKKKKKKNKLINNYDDKYKIPFDKLNEKVIEFKVKYKTDFTEEFEKYKKGGNDDEFISKMENIEYEKNLESNVFLYKIAYIGFWIIIEIALIKFAKQSQFKGMAKYFIEKMDSFSELMYSFAKKGIVINKILNKNEDTDNDENILLIRIFKILIVEIFVFTIASICSGSKYGNKNMMEEVRKIKLNSGESSNTDIAGFFANAFTSMFNNTNNKEDNYI